MNINPDLKPKEAKYRKLGHKFIAIVAGIIYVAARNNFSDLPILLEEILGSYIFATIFIKAGLISSSILAFYCLSYSSKRSLLKSLFSFRIDDEVFFEASYLKPFLYTLIFICFFEITIFVMSI